MSVRKSLALFSGFVCLVATLAHADTPRRESLFTQAGEHRFVTGATPRRLIHFTFDDGPSVATTRALLDVLDTLEIKATFFLSGTKLSTTRPEGEEALAIARETAARGHRLASHSFRHTRLDRLSESRLRSELDAATSSFARISESAPDLFRPPHGMHNASLDRALVSRSMVLVNWNLNPTDYSVRDSASVVRNFFNVLRARERLEGSRGGIVLMHDTLRWSREAMPEIVRELHARNCALLSRNEELYEISNDIADFIGGPSAASARAEPDPTRQERVRERARMRCASR